MEPLNTAIVGAGFTSKAHLDVLKHLKGVRVAGICDRELEKAERAADDYEVPNFSPDLEGLFEKCRPDAVHVLVPPKPRFNIVKACLEKGLHVLVEMPISLDEGEILGLGEAARQRNLVLRVNHNLAFAPPFLRLLKDLGRGRFGKPEGMVLLHSTPLAQLRKGDFTHFMFRSEANILWDQGIQLFSVVLRLLGTPKEVRAHASEPIILQNGYKFRKEWSIHVETEKGKAIVLMKFGPAMPETRMEFLGSDGSARLDLIRGTYERTSKTRWHDSVDRCLNALSQGFSLAGSGMGYLLKYVLHASRLYPVPDPFMEGMRNSISEFYKSIRRGGPDISGAEEGLRVHRLCLAAAGSSGAPVSEFPLPEIRDAPPSREGEVLVTGGTGFIGKSLIPMMLEEGLNVTLLLRKPENLPRFLVDKRIRYFKGDVLDGSSVEKAVRGVKYVIHMAACEGDLPGGAEKAMEDGARIVAEAGIREGIERFVFISSYAALYLGRKEVIEGDPGPDPRPECRSAYSRGKIRAERLLRTLEKEAGLGLVILRPFVVVGKGGIPEHSGIGMWTRDNHCTGFGTGGRPIPFLLVDDCAKAIILALRAEGAGGKAYNLPGDVHLTAREYVRELRKATGRAYCFHGRPLALTWLMENAKALVKGLSGMKGGWLSMRDLRSRAFMAKVSNGTAKKDLGWSPVWDRRVFMEKGIRVHSSG